MSVYTNPHFAFCQRVIKDIMTSKENPLPLYEKTRLLAEITTQLTQEAVIHYRKATEILSSDDPEYYEAAGLLAELEALLTKLDDSQLLPMTRISAAQFDSFSADHPERAARIQAGFAPLRP